MMNFARLWTRSNRCGCSNHAWKQARWVSGRYTIAEQLWRALDELGDKQSYYLLEEFLPGDVYHVDTLSVDGKSVFVSYQKVCQATD